MPYVLTVDQIASRGGPDLIEETIAQLAPLPTLLPFVRTVGDEFQGLLDDAVSVVAAILALMRTQQWHIGLGIGAVDPPLPADSRAARGAAFVAARSAVEAAKNDAHHLEVIAADAGHEGSDAGAVLRLVAAVLSRRTAAGWEVIDLTEQGMTQREIGERLDISRQAVGQRLQAAQWEVEAQVRPALARLLERADGRSS